MYLLEISTYCHDSDACLVTDGEVVAAAIHWLVGDDWTVAAFLQRCGLVVPLSLLGVSLYRSLY